MAIRVDTTPAQLSQTQTSTPAQTAATQAPPVAADRRVAMQSGAPHYEGAPGAHGALAPAQPGGARFPEAWSQTLREAVLELVKNPDATKALNLAFTRGYSDFA